MKFIVKLALVLVLAGIGYGAWWWKGYQHRRELVRLEEATGEQVFRAFFAGISPGLIAGRTDGLEVAGNTLLNSPKVAFVHVLRPKGEVLYSSDVRLRRGAEVGERGEWALAARELTSRKGELPNTTELAAPISAPDGVVAVLWLGYRVGRPSLP